VKKEKYFLSKQVAHQPKLKYYLWDLSLKKKWRRHYCRHMLTISALRRLRQDNDEFEPCWAT
jgi:hypothetical protein